MFLLHKLRELGGFWVGRVADGLNLSSTGMTHTERLTTNVTGDIRSFTSNCAAMTIRHAVYHLLNVSKISRGVMPLPGIIMSRLGSGNVLSRNIVFCMNATMIHLKISPRRITNRLGKRLNSLTVRIRISRGAGALAVDSHNVNVASSRMSGCVGRVTFSNTNRFLRGCGSSGVVNRFKLKFCSTFVMSGGIAVSSLS